MKIDLTDFRDKNITCISFAGEIKEDTINIGGRKIEFIKPIKYDGNIYRVDDDKILQVDIIYAYKELCGRCLEPFVREDKTVLSEQLVYQSDLDQDDENYSIVYNYDDKLDLTEEIINTIVLSLPMKPLCKEDCEGLCPHCGSNLNEDKCDCRVDNIDPRFSVLKDLHLDD